MRNYETFFTTADLGIRFRGRDFRDLYGNALRVSEKNGWLRAAIVFDV